MNRKKSALNRFVNAMTSMRLTIVVLIILAVASIFAIIFQEYHPTNFYGWEEYYASHLNSFKFKLFSAFQLFTPYNSWWFIALLTILCTSLLFCSVNRLRGAWKFVFGSGDFRSSEKLSKQKNFHAFKMPEGSAMQAVTQTLRRKFYKVLSKKEGDRTHIYAKKNTWSRLGPFLSHIGLLALFAGGLVAAIAGKSVMLWGEPGDFIAPAFADHKVLVDDFQIIFNEKGQIKDYISSLRVFDSSDNFVMEQQIEVNHPLRYNGVSYYQSSYRLNPRKVKNLALTISAAGSELSDTLIIDFGKRTGIAGTEYSLELNSFAADFQITQQGVMSKSDELRNPAFLITYYKSEEEIGHQWLFAKFPSVHASKDLPLTVGFLNFEPIYYTGLQAASNPGSYFIWAGFIIMTLGLLLVFYLNHQQVWVTIIHSRCNKDEIFIAGTSHKFKDQFKHELKNIISKVKVRKKNTLEENQSASEVAIIN